MSTWTRVNRNQPCEACGKPDDCTRSGDGLIVKCMRVASDRKIQQSDGRTAYLHSVLKLGGTPVKSKPGKPPKRLTEKEIIALLKEHKTALSPRRLEITAKNLGVSEKSLLAYGLGYDSNTDCVSAPMYDGSRKPIGIHLRGVTGKKMAVVGSRNGLFIPLDYSDEAIPVGVCDEDSPLLLLMPEGLSDCCAARDAGFRAIGRFSNAGGADQIVSLLQQSVSLQDVVVVGERDETKYDLHGVPYWPGIEGALQICDELIRLKAKCSRLRFLMPPVGVGKDLREWLGKDCPITEFLYQVRMASVVSPAWLRAARARIVQRKKNERKAVPA